MYVRSPSTVIAYCFALLLRSLTFGEVPFWWIKKRAGLSGLFVNWYSIPLPHLMRMPITVSWFTAMSKVFLLFIGNCAWPENFMVSKRFPIRIPNPFHDSCCQAELWDPCRPSYAPQQKVGFETLEVGSSPMCSTSLRQREMGRLSNCEATVWMLYDLDYLDHPTE